MTTIDKLEPNIEKLTERIRSLNFTFKDAELQQEAENARDEAIELLESYLELATQDWEQSGSAESSSEEDETS